MKRLLSRIADLVMGGPVSQPAKPLPEILFYPIIFANGRDDDSEGLKAFYENRPYILRGKLYQPSTSPRRLVGLNIALSCDGIAFIREGRVCAGFGRSDGKLLSVSVSHGVLRSLDFCNFTLGIPVKP